MHVIDVQPGPTARDIASDRTKRVGQGIAKRSPETHVSLDADEISLGSSSILRPASTYITAGA